MKKIKKGELAGLNEISEENFIAQEQEVINSVIPTREVPVVAFVELQQNCKAGHIDACQNASWCGQCIDASRKDTNPAKKIVTGFQDILDIPAYLEQAKVMMN